jgi:CheY-like chemotaxis protein
MIYYDEEQAMVERSKILIVDDEPFNVDYLQQELEDLGYATISAANGQEALEKVAAEAPDLILTRCNDAGHGRVHRLPYLERE